MIESVSGVSSTSLLSSITGPRSAGPSAGPAAATGSDSGADFASALADGARGLSDQLKAADSVSMQGMAGEASTREVADAVMSAEQSLQTAIAVRDKIVTAFLDISRMQI